MVPAAPRCEGISAQSMSLALQKPRFLLVVESPAIAHYHSAALTASGFDVVVVADGESALAAFAHEAPVIMAVDPVLPGIEPSELIRTIRAENGTSGIPIFILPAVVAQLCETCMQAGGTRVLQREPHPSQVLADLSRTICRQPGSGAGVAWPTAEQWMPIALKHVTELRNAQHALMREPRDRPAWHALIRYAHALTEVFALAGEGALCQLSAAVELFLHDLTRMPEQLNASMLRTLGQTLDFFAAQLLHTSPGTLKPTAGSKVLVVEDDQGARQLISAALQMASLQPQLADTPSIAVKALAESKFDLIFLDIGLPEISGFDVCTKIRSTPGHDGVPILFLTGMTTIQNRAQSKLLGGNDFIGKPFNVLELGIKALLWVSKGRLAELAA